MILKMTCIYCQVVSTGLGHSNLYHPGIRLWEINGRSIGKFTVLSRLHFQDIDQLIYYHVLSRLYGNQWEIDEKE
jgi:hypothetical protein